MQRVIAFIDGFNMYHSIVDAKLNNLKWINYYSLANAFIKKQTETVTSVYYFSALVPWEQDKTIRHKHYIRALEHAGVNVILGKFKAITRKCRGTCKERYSTYEEKETDVNIAVKMISLAMQDRFDKCLLFTGDSDLIAAVKEIKHIAPTKNVKAIIPFQRSSIDLVNNCHENARIRLHHIKNNQFPMRIVLDSSKNIYLDKPAEWS